MIESANFSSQDLRSEYRETLADITRDRFKHFDNYLKIIKDNNVKEPTINKSLYNNISFDLIKKNSVKGL